jgi:hypothetical protein
MRRRRDELFTLDVFHRQEVTPIGLTDVVNAANVLVAHLSRNAYFTMKPGEGSAVT